MRTKPPPTETLAKTIIDDAVNLEENSDIEKGAKFRKNLRTWAVSYNVLHATLRQLFQNINKRFPNVLSQGPRTLLKTYQTVSITKVGNGSYRHHGLELIVRQTLQHLTNVPNVALSLSVRAHEQNVINFLVNNLSTNV